MASYPSSIALVALALSFTGSVCMPTITGGGPKVEEVHLPPGFEITVFAKNVKNARAMCWGDKSTLFVGTRSEGVVHALRDADGDGVAEERWEVAKDLSMPVGVTFRNGALYVSAVDRIVRLDAIEDHLDDPPKPITVFDGFPKEEHHGWKFIAFGPDDMLYVPVGAPCNVCESTDSIFSTITRMRPDGTDLQIVAKGVRNSVGFDWRPGSNEFWFTENGRDWMGDDQPDCELIRLENVGDHFGFPYCHAPNLPDPEFGAKRSCDEFKPAAALLGPHVAPLGMRFYRGSAFPEAYHGAIFIAEHGSWNRTDPIGYRIVVAYPDPDGTARTEVFADGWLKGTRAWGRPVDVLEAPDGALLVSDDAADMIYRIAYTGK